MKHLPRRLAVLGGAAAIAAGGFAFLAENQAQSSSLGEGQSVVTGYSVSNITYQDTTGPVYTSKNPTYTATDGSKTANGYVRGVTFKLAAATATMTAEPTTVIVSAMNYSTKVTTGVAGNGRPLSNKYDWGTTYTTSGTSPQNRFCTVTSWTSTSNSGTVTCQWTFPYYSDNAGSPSDAPFAETVTGLNVTASN